MNTLTERLNQIRAQITKTESRFHRSPDSVKLLAVSKTRPVADILEAWQAGQRDFGENYLQDALPKIAELADKDIRWHFIGPIQSNKTRAIAENFQWVHSVDRLKIAQRLNEQRPADCPALNICLQVNVSHDAAKSGLKPEAVPTMVKEIQHLDRLCLRGLMTVPAQTDDFEAQRLAFHDLKTLFDDLNNQGMVLDTLSMGMTGDMDAAIAEGSTLVRIGTAIFGQRPAKA